MDPFTIITGASGLLSTLQGIINEAKSFVVSWKDCPNELIELRDELQALETLLKDIKPIADRLRIRNSHDRNATQPAAVVNLLNLAAEIKKLLEPYQGPENLSKIYKKPDKKQRLGWKSTKDDIQNLRERIAGCLNELQLAMAADTSSGVMDAIEKLDIIKDEGNAEIDRKKRDEILEWLFTGDPGRRHNEVRGRLEENTGCWIYETEQFKAGAILVLAKRS